MIKIKIVHIQLLPLLSGVQNMMLSILSSLDPDKYDIYVISKSGGPMVDKVIELGYTHIPLNSLRRNISFMDVVAFASLFKIFKKYKFDIVHTHSSKTGFIGRIAARLANTPKIIHTVHGFPFHPYSKKSVKIIYTFLEKFAAHFCDFVVFVNNSERQMAIKEKIVSEKKAVTIYNGIDYSEQVIKKQDKQNFVIGSCLRFWEQKNIIATVDVAVKVCHENEFVKFIFIGDGSLFSEVKEMVCNAGLEERILLPGWQNNVTEWFKEFDLFLLYSKWEGLPISILEAMAYGLPIVASDIKGNNELVSSDNGVLVSVDEPAKLKDVLLELYNKSDLLDTWGGNSRKLIREKFALSDFINNYLYLYEK